MRQGRVGAPAESAAKALKLVILLADTPVPSVLEAHGDYHDIFSGLFARAIESHDDKIALDVQSFDTVKGEFPRDELVQAADGVLITGSAASAYKDDKWITDLVSYTASLPTSAPLIGICFGHQIIARAHGAVVEKNEKGWEIGTRDIDLNELGQAIWRGASGAGTTLPVQQMHQDHVPGVPEGFEVLGTTSICPNHSMVRRRRGNLGAIITLQGHPEFTPEIVLKIIDRRESMGIISEEIADESRRHAQTHDAGVAIARLLLKIMQHGDIV